MQQVNEKEIWLSSCQCGRMGESTIIAKNVVCSAENWIETRIGYLYRIEFEEESCLNERVLM